MLKSVNYINCFCFENNKFVSVVTIPLFLTNITNIPSGSIWVANNKVTRFDLWLLAKWNAGSAYVTYGNKVYVMVQGDVCIFNGIHEAPEVNLLPYKTWEQLSTIEREKLQPWIITKVDTKYIRMVEETFNLPFGRVTTESAVFVCDGFYISIYEARCNNLFVE